MTRWPRFNASSKKSPSPSRKRAHTTPMNDKLSIIIPCFNSERTLRQAVKSCFSQSLGSAFEIVLVDDCSTDGTPALMKKLAEEHPEIICAFHATNKGGGAARNTAVARSSGSVIFCLDSDDLLPPGTLAKMLTFLREKNSDAVGIHRSIKFKGSDPSNIDVVHQFGYAGERIPFESLLQRDNVYCPLYSTFMITREAFDRIRGYPEGHGFDTQGIAWRFLCAGLTAYTCPDAEYLHRTHFNESYYLREAAAGKVNYNWQDVLSEHLSLFNDATQKFILNFNCADFSKNLFVELLKRERIFRPDYEKLIGTLAANNHSFPPKQRVYIKRNSVRGLIIRVRERLKKIERLRSAMIAVLALSGRITRLATERKVKREYFSEIKHIKDAKKIVVELVYGGIGDCLVWSTLPRLLKDTYDIDFYLSRKSLEVLRQPDIFKLCFESNPYFKGIADTGDVFFFRSFESDKSIWSIMTDREGPNAIETLERQFGVVGYGRPELYYKPKLVPAYKDIIILDENTVTGKKLGWRFKKDAFLREALKYAASKESIERVDPKKQSLFEYVDMIYSCKRFVGTFSGGASIAACFDKPFSVIWPINGRNGTNYPFRFKNSRGDYVS